MTYNINVSNTYTVYNGCYPSPETTATDKGPEILSYSHLTIGQAKFNSLIGAVSGIKEELEGMEEGPTKSELIYTLGKCIEEIYLEFEGKLDTVLIMKKILYAIHWNSEKELADLRCYTKYLNQNPNRVISGSYEQIVEAIRLLGY